MKYKFPLIVLSAVCISASCQQFPNSQIQPQRSSIPDEEVHFTPQQLKEYYLVYSNADVKYLRTVMDAYLKGAKGREAEFEQLKKFDKEYYKSKFIVASRDGNPFGGTMITIMFEDKPDKVFVAWVYKAGAKGTLTLKGFDIREYSPEEIAALNKRYAEILRDKVHAM